MMMKVVFDVDDASLRDSFLRTFFFGALDALTAEHRPRWGLMTAQQMVEHLAWAFELSTGRAQVECSIPEDQLPRMKTFLYRNRPSPQGFMNPALRDGLPALRHPDLRQARAALQTEVDRFIEQQRTHPTAIHTHPIFGPIGADEWSRTHFKHGLHHLLQFGLLETEP
jgi:oxepin-CoA hydrolase / 3-oxo-5,6-dehydrosuberyl-CoA semialdehyde dehydrogenase